MDASTDRTACRDCQGLTSASVQPTRAHPYLVFSGTSRATGAREFLCVLCRTTFSFELQRASAGAGGGQAATFTQDEAAHGDASVRTVRPGDHSTRGSGGCGDTA